MVPATHAASKSRPISTWLPGLQRPPGAAARDVPAESDVALSAPSRFSHAPFDDRQLGVRNVKKWLSSAPVEARWTVVLGDREQFSWRHGGSFATALS